MVPKNLAKFGGATDMALSQFGMIKGMALPILFFPSTILNSVSTLLIPEISEAVARNRNAIIKESTGKVLKLTSLIGFLFGAIFFVCGERIGYLLYSDQSVGFLLKALSPIVPLMYLDSISDGILKGLDQQIFTFRTAIFDSTVRIILILVLLAKTGLWGFIGIMYFSNFLTCFLNVRRLIKVSHANLSFLYGIFTPICLSLISTLFVNSLMNIIPEISNLVYIMLFCGFSCAFYFSLLVFFKIISFNDLKTARNMHK